MTEKKTDPETLRAAAAVVLVRPEIENPREIFLVRRSKRLAFLGGFDAFPGGTTDRADEEVSVVGEPDDPARYSTAVRELFEETGVLLTEGADQVPLAERKEARKRLIQDGSVDWPQWLEAQRLIIDDRRFIPMGRWVTPPYTPRRFEAVYYAAEWPSDQPPEIWEGELSAGRWVRLRDALNQHHEGNLFLSYPVLETLRSLVCHPRLRDAAEELNARDTRALEGGEMMHGLHVCPGRTFTLPPATHTNTYVLGGQELVVVDPATPIAEDQRRLRRYLDRLCETGARVREIWLTHHHKDHVGAVQWLRDELQVPVAAHALTREALAPNISIDRVIEDGEVATLDCAPGPVSRWRAVFTPGHAAGHLCFFEEQRRILLSGDNVLGLGSVLIPPDEGDMAQYLDSLALMRDLEAEFLFPAHGPPVSSVREKIQGYIDHRLAREAAILGALTEPATPSEIVSRVYTDVDPRAYPLAELNVRSHLDKLVAEKKVSVVRDMYQMA